MLNNDNTSETSETDKDKDKTQDCLLDSEGEVLTSAIYAPALWGEHASNAANMRSFALRPQQPQPAQPIANSCSDNHSKFELAHQLMVLDEEDRTRLKSLYQELSSPGISDERKNAIIGIPQQRGELEALLEDAVARGLRELPGRIAKNLADADANAQKNNLPKKAIDDLTAAKDRLNAAKDRLDTVIGKFKTIDFSPKDVQDIASHFVSIPGLFNVRQR